MQLMTFNEALTLICDSFDSLISPKKLARANTNVIYLIFKAIAKGYEVINNICVVLSNKFDPAKCSAEDLESVASIVGTERLKGSGSGLHILVRNEENTPVTLLSGKYEYALDDDTTFLFEVFEDTEITKDEPVTFIAMTSVIGRFPVTAQSDIEITSEQTIPEELKFSCTDNANLLGTFPETDLEFRQRIIEGYNNQDTIVELENELRNLPYLFDCRIKYNNAQSEIVYDGITVRPFEALICYSGSLRNEIAEIIASKIICPTVQTADSVAVTYKNPVFITGEQQYYLTPFKFTEFNVEVIYKINNTYISEYDAKEKIKIALQQNYTTEVHSDYIKEDDIYTLIDNLDISGIELLGVNLYVGGTKVDYVNIPATRIPKLNEISFTKE